MRALSTFLLISATAFPALAAGDNDGEKRRQRHEPTQQSEPSGQRDSSSERAQPEGRLFGASRSGRSESGKDQGPMPLRRGNSGHHQDQVAGQQESNEPAKQGRRANRVGEHSGYSSGLRPLERRIRTIPDPQTTMTTSQSSEVRSGLEQRSRRDYRNGDYARWSTKHWRGDHRYDWRHHRDRHRSLYRLGFYYDPFGWSYRRWQIGWRMWPSYYGSRYWLDDPWRYRLPPAYGPYRWVRYWDDALLVNIYTGEVVDVIHHFFW